MAEEKEDMAGTPWISAVTKDPRRGCFKHGAEEFKLFSLPREAGMLIHHRMSVVHIHCVSCQRHIFEAKWPHVSTFCSTKKNHSRYINPWQSISGTDHQVASVTAEAKSIDAGFFSFSFLDTEAVSNTTFTCLNSKRTPLTNVTTAEQPDVPVYCTEIWR